jgi:hypothetical protein
MNLNDGRILWQHEFATASSAPSNPYVSRAAPTPVEELEGSSAPTPRSIGAGKLLIGASVGREGGASTKAVATNGLVEVKPVPNADGEVSPQWKAEYVWRSQKATCSFCSPVSIDRHAYFIARGGI